jgi:hypothetical protein
METDCEADGQWVTDRPDDRRCFCCVEVLFDSYVLAAENCGFLVAAEHR